MHLDFLSLMQIRSHTFSFTWSCECVCVCMHVLEAWRLHWGLLCRTAGCQQSSCRNVEKPFFYVYEGAWKQEVEPNKQVDCVKFCVYTEGKRQVISLWSGYVSDTSHSASYMNWFHTFYHTSYFSRCSMTVWHTPVFFDLKKVCVQYWAHLKPHNSFIAVCYCEF